MTDRSRPVRRLALLSPPGVVLALAAALALPAGGGTAEDRAAKADRLPLRCTDCAPVETVVERVDFADAGLTVLSRTAAGPRVAEFVARPRATPR